MEVPNIIHEESQLPNITAAYLNEHPREVPNIIAAYPNEASNIQISQHGRNVFFPARFVSKGEVFFLLHKDIET